MNKREQRVPAWTDQHGPLHSAVLMQPYFLGWLGFYELFFKPNLFVYLDDFDFTRHGRGQSNTLLINSQIKKMTLSVSHTGGGPRSYIDVMPVHDTRWTRKFLSTVSTAYIRAPYHAAILNMLQAWLEPTYANLADMLIAFNEHLCKYLNTERPYLRSSQITYDATAKRSQRIYNIVESIDAKRYYATSGSVNYMFADNVFPCSTVEVLFQDFRPQPYPQVNSPDFTPYLSALDALFNVSPYTFLNHCICGTTDWLSWQRAGERWVSPINI